MSSYSRLPPPSPRPTAGARVSANDLAGGPSNDAELAAQRRAGCYCAVLKSTSSRRQAGGFFTGNPPAFPSAVRAEAKEICVELWVPGFAREEVEVTVNERLLRVSARAGACHPGQRDRHSDGPLFDSGEETRWDAITHSLLIPPAADPRRFHTRTHGGRLIVCFARRLAGGDAEESQTPVYRAG